MNEDGRTNTNQETDASEQRLLVAVSPSQISEKLVRWAHRLAVSLNCPWIAMYVEVSPVLSEEDHLHLTRTLAEARTLGAEVITTTGTDLVRELLHTAVQRNVTQIIIGKSIGKSYRRFFRSDKWMDRLLQESGELDIHIVRFHDRSAAKAAPVKVKPYGSTLKEYLAAVAIILATAWTCSFATSFISYQAIAWIFIAVVVVMAAFVGRGATFLAAILSAMLWDFLFEQPVYSFSIGSLEDRILFVIYIIIAVVLGQLTAQIRRQERVERDHQERATALQTLTRELTEATGLDDMLARALRQTSAVFKAEVAMLLPSSAGRLGAHPAGSFQITEEEFRLAAWAYAEGRAAGKFTVHQPRSTALLLPLTAYSEKYGVLALRPGEPFPPSIHQRNLLDAFSEEIALSIHRYRSQEISERAKVLAESERLSKTLLNSISHEIRTPLAVIQSATTYMVDFEKPDYSASQKTMIAEIQEATDRLNRLVGKVLEITRLESGHVKPKFEASEVNDLVQMAEGETRKELARHKLTIEIAADLPPVPMDFELMLHALSNLLSNAAFHTPPGTEVQLQAKTDNGSLLLTVADGGPGIPPASLPHLFEKFYRAPNARTGGTGLGLSLVKGFVQAQGGHVTAENRAEGGATFTIRLPLERSVD
jgi:two-component system, OmpR family, sensor histidine kinase KdpD